MGIANKPCLDIRPSEDQIAPSASTSSTKVGKLWILYLSSVYLIEYHLSSNYLQRLSFDLLFSTSSAIAPAAVRPWLRRRPASPPLHHLRHLVFQLVPLLVPLLVLHRVLRGGPWRWRRRWRRRWRFHGGQWRLLRRLVAAAAALFYHLHQPMLAG